MAPISNVLDYRGTPAEPFDRQGLAFSDQGAWFAFGLPAAPTHYGGFSGPFLMTQENGVWISPALCQLQLTDSRTGKAFPWDRFQIEQHAYLSHLEQKMENDSLQIRQRLFFSSQHSAIILTEITNTSPQDRHLKAIWQGQHFLNSIQLGALAQGISLNSNKSSARGVLNFFEDIQATSLENDSSYRVELAPFVLAAGESRELVLAVSFVFPAYDLPAETGQLRKIAQTPAAFLDQRILEKETQRKALLADLDPAFLAPTYEPLLLKSLLTLQNNWRAPAGELKHHGLFPSYHYKWFHGFWAWDSWKHAVALARYHPALAMEQVRAMYDFMDDRGFIADCVYRDTTIEAHNFRNSKPPLSAWAVYKIYQAQNDLEFLREMYPLVRRQHEFWYRERDHDQDSLCEYGATDGTLIAAKWESGMDNAVRFDDSKILKNAEGAYSLDQESVDLNSYLYAEKLYLAKLAQALGQEAEQQAYLAAAAILKTKIQAQFFDPETGWFYDTSLDGKHFVKVMGCEGWIPLWAQVATAEQARQVKNNMMDSLHFYLPVPFQTLDASHAKFKPDGGYWRGPNWLDQAYFGVRGLHNYGFHAEAYAATRRLMHNAAGVLEQGPAIRENYHPVSGKGLESQNFSWSAAHYLLLLLND